MCSVFLQPSLSKLECSFRSMHHVTVGILRGVDGSPDQGLLNWTERLPNNMPVDHEDIPEKGLMDTARAIFKYAVPIISIGCPYLAHES